MANQLNNADRAALLALMGAGGQVSNTELEAIAGFRLDGESRRRLNKALLVESTRSGNKPFNHTLTQSGWSWCTEELVAPRPEKPGQLGGALYSVLRGLGEALEARNLTLLGFLSSGERSIESDIRAVYRKLADRRRAMVRLADLRPLLNGASRAEVDEALKAMSKGGRARLMPDSNRKTLTDADHQAAIQLSRQDNHLIVIEES